MKNNLRYMTCALVVSLLLQGCGAGAGSATSSVTKKASAADLVALRLLDGKKTSVKQPKGGTTVDSKTVVSDRLVVTAISGTESADSTYLFDYNGKSYSFLKSADNHAITVGDVDYTLKKVIDKESSDVQFELKDSKSAKEIYLSYGSQFNIVMTTEASASELDLDKLPATGNSLMQSVKESGVVTYFDSTKATVATFTITNAEINLYVDNAKFQAYMTSMVSFQAEAAAAFAAKFQELGTASNSDSLVERQQALQKELQSVYSGSMNIPFQIDITVSNKKYSYSGAFSGELDLTKEMVVMESGLYSVSDSSNKVGKITISEDGDYAISVYQDGELVKLSSVK